MLSHLNSQWLATSRAYKNRSLLEATGHAHQPHDPRFPRQYDGQGNVRMSDRDTGEASPWFRVNYELDAEAAWMEGQRAGVRS